MAAFRIGALFTHVLIAGATSLEAQTTMRFTNVTEECGVGHLYFFASDQSPMTGGCVAEDFNGDGWVDLFVTQGNGTNHFLYINDGKGGFTNQAAARGISSRQPMNGAAAADIDNDGDIDIIAATGNNEASRCWLNDGTGNFTEAPWTMRAPAGICQSASIGDIDLDGYLEIVVGRWWNTGDNLVMYRRNQADGTWKQYQFRDVANVDKFVFAPRFADLDGDRYPELAVANDFGNSQLYHNLRNGTMRNITNAKWPLTDENAMGATIADYDGDGDLDWFMSNIYDTVPPSGDEYGITGNRLYRNDGFMKFSDATEEAGVRDGNWGWGASFGDFDNDGDLDIFHVNGWTEGLVAAKWNKKPARLFENDGTGRFTDVAATAGADDRGQGRGIAVFDFDNDGDLDIFIANNRNFEPPVTTAAKPTLLRNDTPSGNNWLKVQLAGTPPLHRHGIGSRVTVTHNGKRQVHELHASTNYLGQNPGRIAHFGLGPDAPHSSIVSGEVVADWVNGDRTMCGYVPVNSTCTLVSPRSFASSRVLEPGEEVTLTAVLGPEPDGNTVLWYVKGERHFGETHVTSFDTPGDHRVRMEVHEVFRDGGGGRGLLRYEELLIHVNGTPPPAGLMVR